jgi:hypothetical protein
MSQRSPDSNNFLRYSSRLQVSAPFAAPEIDLETHFIYRSDAILCGYRYESRDPDKLFSSVLKFLDDLDHSPLAADIKKKIVNYIDIDSKTGLFHMLAEFDTPGSLWAKAASMGFTPNLRNGDGNTVLMIAAAAGHDSFSNALSTFQEKYDFSRKDVYGRNLFQIAFSCGNLLQAWQIKKASKVIYRMLKEETVREFIEGEAVELTKIKAFDKIYKFYNKIHQDMKPRLCDFIQRHGNMEHALGYANSFNAITERHGVFDGTPFIHLFPAIYSGYGQDQAHDLLTGLEILMDSNDKLHHAAHPNIAEFMGLLSHPQNKWDDNVINVITRAISSPFRLIENDSENIGMRTACAWTVAGILQYSLKQLKYDTMRPRIYVPDSGIELRKSLVEQYGMKRIESKSELGQGYYFLGSDFSFGHELDYFGKTNLRKDFVMGLYMGGLFGATNEGCVFLKNASENAGRANFDHTGFVSEKSPFASGLSPVELQKEFAKITPEWIDKNMRHMFSVDLYKDKEKEFGKFTRIIEQMYLVWRDYRGWQCDTNRHTSILIDENGKKFKTGGHNSAGFQPTIDFLLNMHAGISDPLHPYSLKGVKMPTISWYVAHQIPVQPFDSLQLGTDQLKALKHLSSRESRIKNKDLICSSGVLDFMNVGFANQAVLMIEENI